VPTKVPATAPAKVPTTASHPLALILRFRA
jgi:hypothetical protein